MQQPVSVRSSRWVTAWATLLCVIILGLLVAACGDTGGTAATTSNTNSANSSSSSASGGQTITVTITEIQGSQDVYNFDPTTVNVKVGDTIKWVNNSDENHQLMSDPAGLFADNTIVPQKKGNNDNTLQTPISKAGTFTITSKLVHRAGGLEEGMSSSAKATFTVSN